MEKEPNIIEIDLDSRFKTMKAFNAAKYTESMTCDGYEIILTIKKVK